jgi:hypothetical protein
MRLGRLTMGITSAAVAIALSAGSAQAATTTVGNPLTSASYDNQTFLADRGLFDPVLISGASGASPVDGTLTGWAVGNAQGDYRIQVIRPIAGGQYRNVAEGPKTNLNFPLAGSPVQAASLPIQKGDFPGLVVYTGAHIFRNSDLGTSDYFDPPLAVGAEGASVGPNETHNWIFNVTIRYCVVPDLKGKSLGAAKKALTAADCTFGKRINPKIKKKKRKKLGVSPRIKSQSVAAGTSISDTAPVDVTFGTKKKKKKK